GATSYDTPEMARTLEPEREDLARAVAETGRYAASAFVESPTFGGGSWLAHSSLMTGTTIKDNGVYNLLLTQRRDSLPRRFERSGYRAVAMMPGLKQAWPEGSFYGFNRTYGAADLEYRGPEFGWWRIPDQYTLAKLDELEISRASRPPLFVFFPTISTHIPFRPTAPYQPDWRRVLGPEPFPSDALAASLAQEPEWTHLSPGYVGALAYTFEYWAGYLRYRPDANFVLILIGDHQPASSVSGEGARWDVPIHVISKRRDIVEALERAGFSAGFNPDPKPLGPMSGLAKLLLDDFEGVAPARSTDSGDPAPGATSAAASASATAAAR
ncbi:MAG TPA: sulfatase-like hydrolase/transferase, partial [Gammaproteobacteria bacterium]|nr:sulfatase-like hydrolase/transferase [Gammaproteobacteria bacterium]